MEIFNAIGLEIPPGKTLIDLAEDAERRGEASQRAGSGGTIHGRCWRIGLGLEVWTTLYESKTGELSYADCRPGFRARYRFNLGDWSLFEDEKEGEAAVSGRLETGDRVFFQLQNLTEVAQRNFEREFLTVGLCGLAYRAEVSKRTEKLKWQPLAEAANSDANETNWHLSGRVVKFNSFCNPVSGHDLYWLHLDVGNFPLEILVNRHILKGKLRVGATVKADIWLQGHILAQSTFFPSYEGVDHSVGTADFWKNYKKLN